MSTSTQNYTQVEPLDFISLPKVNIGQLVLGNDISFFLLKYDGEVYNPVKTFFNGDLPTQKDLEGEYWLVPKETMKEVLKNN